MKTENNKEIIIYESTNGQPRIEVHLENENLWLTQLQLVELYNSSKANVSEHIKNIFEEKELNKESTVRKFRTVQIEGKREVVREIEHYNLELIISLGYRINSQIATRFRQWATARLKEYIVKGFTMDDERLKEMGSLGYWKELLNRIRDIRSSEKVFYRQILEIYATSIDYDAKAETSIEFFKKVQNKIHFAVHGNTAAELIYNRVDSGKEFMGLTTFSGLQPQLADAKIAKNYLSEKELRALGQIVSGYLDFAERQAEREVPMKMKDWAEHLDNILQATGEQILSNAGKISNTIAIKKVTTEYKKYQSKNLSVVEKSYLETIKGIRIKIEGKIKNNPKKSK